MLLLQAGHKKFTCEAVLLDKDGTLLDFKTMWLEWARYIIENIKAVWKRSPVSQIALERAMGIDLVGWQVDPRGALARGDITVLQKNVAQVLEQGGVTKNEAGELIRKIVIRSESAVDWGSLARPVAGLRDKLDDLHKKSLNWPWSLQIARTGR